MKQAIISLFVLSLIFPVDGRTQVSGCTDPQALNYNPEATSNDGSCLYPATSISPAVVVRSLPLPVHETSGLIYWNGGLWTHNDSGNQPVLYKMDTLTGLINQTVNVTGAENTDWEDIAQDDDYIYIGDFGNNSGNRTDLKVYITEKSAFPFTGNGNVPSEVIYFSYGDQPSFAYSNRNNDYDCEALISFGDSLYLFTKNWVNEQTRLYGMPKLPGTYTLFPLASMDSDGLITGADVSADGSEVILCGYRNYHPFVWLLFDFQGSGFFTGNKRRIDFQGMLGTQTEGISYTYGSKVYISSEKTTVMPAKLFRMETAPWTGSAATGTHGWLEPRKTLKLYPNPSDGGFCIDFGSDCNNSHYVATIMDCYGAPVVKDYPIYPEACAANICFPDLAGGLYLVSVSGNGSIMTGRLMIR